MLHMGYSSPFVIALVYDITSLYKKIRFHPVTYGGDMIAFVSESTHLVIILFQAEFFLTERERAQIERMWIEYETTW